MLPHLVSFSKRKPDSKVPRWSVALGGAGTPATSNLRMYLSHAQLPRMILGCNIPRMPEEGHKTHRNVLSVRAEDWRKLTEMNVISSPDFDKQISEFIRAHIPSHDLHVIDPDVESGDRLTLPSPVFRVAETIVGRPSDMYRVSRWVTEFPLATLQRVMHLAFPHTQEWSLSPLMADPDQEIVSCVTWDRRNSDSTVDSAVAVMMQPPWIASAMDLECFVNCKRLPRPSATSVNTDDEAEYNSSERMWAKIWDLCARRNCHYFVVTTYWGWAFGAFSLGKTRGFVTSVKHWDTHSPSILEYLTFWFASAMQISGGWEMPKVAEAVFDVNLGIEDVALPPDPYVPLHSPAPSESAWEAGAQENADATDAEEVAVLLLSPAGLHNAPMLPWTDELAARLAENVMNWQQNGTPYHIWGLPPSAHTAPSEVSTAITESSATSVFTDPGGRRTGGNWLTERPIDETRAHQLAI
ncbi:hypothetical protein BDY19DRAFT_918096 [Irpex rosettiformis]|uniref:Uncharacterized protein n=1 Tax=Irpex rosettiformis TaxID=378272 RepID=A0ACB8UH04_9APHY|nr:hypothetical protein BDY19DRAFT_918096 [Irpex rosettiformis]